MKNHLLAFGEILFDVYPSGAKIGGAPLNFAAHFAALGNHSAVYSAVGRDEYGNRALSFLAERGIDSRYVSRLSDRPTGYCAVTYRDGEPQYDLVRDVAYDAIGEIDEIGKIDQPNRTDERFPRDLDLFYYGSLAQRSPTSRETLATLLAAAKAQKNCRIFCDLNLRGDFYDRETIEFCLRGADIVKLNREEHACCRNLFCDDLDPARPDALETFAASLCEKFAVRMLLVTLDSDGSFLYDSEGRKAYRKGNAQSNFVSAVGAGDSFSACFLHHLLSGTPIEIALEKAARLAAFVVSREEAIPAYPDDLKSAIQ